MMEALYWLTAAAALLGVWLNIYGRRACFAIWALTNAVWAVVDFAHGIYAQGVLMSVYFALSIYGLWRWGKFPRGEGAA